MASPEKDLQPEVLGFNLRSACRGVPYLYRINSKRFDEKKLQFLLILNIPTMKEES